ncbi:unnamed protein product, partial [Darwinula stevensoni]
RRKTHKAQVPEPAKGRNASETQTVVKEPPKTLELPEENEEPPILSHEEVASGTTASVPYVIVLLEDDLILIELAIVDGSVTSRKVTGKSIGYGGLRLLCQSLQCCFSRKVQEQQRSRYPRPPPGTNRGWHIGTLQKSNQGLLS